MNKIEDAIELEKYLHLRLLDCVHNENQASVVIWSFISNLDANTKIRVMENLRYGNAQICICMKCASMGINIPDIIRVVQFEILDFIVLPKLLQRLGWGGRDKSCAVVAIIFVYSRQILPDNMHTQEHSAFKSLRLPVSKENYK